MKHSTLKNLITTHPALEDFLFRFINLPIINSIYKKVYILRIKNVIKSQDLLVVIEPYNICNLRCVMCPYPKMTRKKELMSMDLFKKIVDEAKKLGCTRIMLQAYSEPLLDPFLIDRIRYIKSRGMKAGFFTNATLLDEKMAIKILNSGLDLIKFSVDAGNKEDYEKIRIGGDWDKVKNNIISFYKKRGELKLKKPRIWIFMIKQESNEKNIKSHKEFWDEYCDEINISIVDNRAEGKISKSFLKKYGRPYPCFMPRDLTILSNGKLVVCCLDYDGKMVLGDLKTQSLKEIMNSDKFKKILELHMSFQGDKIKMCKNCTRLYKNSAFYWWVARR